MSLKSRGAGEVECRRSRGRGGEVAGEAEVVVERGRRRERAGERGVQEEGKGEA
jgi:hypothetical protein